ncbi:hypothetical protein J6590_064065 [Homalodisca vitripennis]|nr:hypothetical protein J6590_064065 [Homalodisca vitripennis]
MAKDNSGKHDVFNRHILLNRKVQQTTRGTAVSLVDRFIKLPQTTLTRDYWERCKHLSLEQLCSTT